MNMRSALILVLAASLAACSGSNQEPAENQVEAPVATPMPVEPDGGIGDGAGPPGEIEGTLANRIPTRFHGVWDYVGGTCDPASDMRAEISGSEILFYESVGTVISVDEDGDDFVVTLAMEGEGETWEQLLRLSLVGEGAGQRLETTDGALPKVTDEYPRKRC